MSYQEKPKDGIPLREYIELKIDGIEKATSLAAASIDKRLESMNEFRQQLNDQKATFLTRNEMNAIREKIDADIDTLKLAKATLEGKASQTSFYISLSFSIIGTIAGIIGLLK